MTPERFEFFKTLLHERLSVLVSEARATVTDLAEGDENYADPTDRAAAESDRSFLLRIRDRERKLIIKIHEALQRVEEGTFGTCETCGDEIGEKRLEARPVTTQCIDCKTEAEHKERAGS